MVKNIRMCAVAMCMLACGLAYAQLDSVNNNWQNIVLESIDLFPQGGGYYTGSKATADFPITAWQGLNNAFVMTGSDSVPQFAPKAARPSFCSSATYAVLISSLLQWDKAGVISRNAWVNMKPYVGIVDSLNTTGLYQDDGQGFWGRANANGPGIAELVHELGAGFSFTAYRGAKTAKNKERPNEKYMTYEDWCLQRAWYLAMPGDFMKIFWDRNSKGSDRGAIIGDNGNKAYDQEAGHSVVFLGTDGDSIYYWSSNGPGKNPKEMGYGYGQCSKADVQRVVFTRILHPERFDNARFMAPDSMNDYLNALNGKRHSNTAEMMRQCGIVDAGKDD